MGLQVHICTEILTMNITTNSGDLLLLEIFEAAPFYEHYKSVFCVLLQVVNEQS
jgi:hypothetical protein